MEASATYAFLAREASKRVNTRYVQTANFGRELLVEIALSIVNLAKCREEIETGHLK